MNIVQALGQALGKQCVAVFAKELNELGTQIDDIVLEDALNPPRQAVFQPHHRHGLHAFVQGQRQGATADHAALVLKHKLFDCKGAFFQQVDRQTVLKIYIRRLPGGPLAEAGAPVIGMPFQVQGIAQLAEHFGLAGTCHATQQNEIALGRGLLQRIEQKGTHGLVATTHSRIVESRLVQPLLDNLRTQAAAKAVQVAVRVGTGELCPLLNTLGLDRTGHQLMPQHNRRLLPLLLVASTHPLALVVGHQRQVDHAGERALDELNRGAGIHHRAVVEKNIAVIGDVDGHQDTSTALLCRSTN